MKFGVNNLIWSGEYNSQVRNLLPGIKEKGFGELIAFEGVEFLKANVRSS